MARSQSITGLLCVLALPLGLGGCAGVLVAGGLAAAAGGGYAAGQERGVGGAVDDFSIKADVEKSMLLADPQLQGNVNATVYQGRVLLTGRVASPQIKMAAAQAAGRAPNVRGVFNEIEVAPSEGMWDDAKDQWITARVRSEMVLDPDVRSINYTIDTANGSVYLIGTARSQAELDRATRIARYVPGVKRVVSYIELAGMPVATGPTPPPAAGPGRGAPRAPIEVQKL